MADAKGKRRTRQPPGANIFLPDYADDEAVAQFDLNVMHMALKSRGLIQETVRNHA